MKIYALVVLYNYIEDEIYENIFSYISEVDKVICMDNSENEASSNSFFRTINKINYFYLKGNIGLAKALKKGMDIAIREGADYVLQFDQDSVMPINSVAMLKKHLGTKDNIAIYAPNINLIYRENNKRLFSKNSLYSNEDIEVNWAITSGSLVRCEIYSKIGGIDDNLFVSGIDRDYCCKVGNAGYKIMRIGNSVLYQEAGNTKEVNLCFYKFHPPYLNEERYYYIFRNEIYLRKKYKSSYNKCKTNLFKYIICISFFESKKKLKIYNAIRGILFGFFKM